MKTALLHYWLTNERGGEKVLAALAEMFPDADVYTHALGHALRDSDGEGDGRWHGHRVRESFIARLPLGRMRPQAYLPLMPLASRALALDGYDLIVSSESGPIKGIRKPKDAKHICYCHTPMRYLWDLYDEYYRQTGLGGKIAMRAFRNYLRRVDLKSAESVDRFVANSQFVAERIRRLYGREASVVPPPVDVAFFAAPSESAATSPFAALRPYYLLAGELVAYKRPDLALAACAKMGRRLVVVGDGRSRAALEKAYAANPCVRFFGRVSGEALRDAYAQAEALLFPGIEDFGIVPVEAQAAGTPVIAYGVGGACETVVPKGRDARATGLFFSEQRVEALCSAIEEFESRAWSAPACQTNAARFAPESFRRLLAQVFLAEGVSPSRIAR